MRREIVAQLFHLRVIGTMQWHVGNLVEPDEIDAAFQSCKQSHDGLRVVERVVDTTENDVLKRQTALMTEVILSEQCHHILYGHRFLGRHQFLSLLVERRVEAYCHMTLALVEKPFQFVLHAHGTHRYALRTPCPTVICG